MELRAERDAFLKRAQAAEAERRRGALERQLRQRRRAHEHPPGRRTFDGLADEYVDELIFPNDQALIRLAGMLCIEQNDEWLVGRGCLSAESISEVLGSPEQNSQDPTTEQRRHLNKEKRRWPNSSRPEPPTSLPTRSARRSYTTSRDLTGWAGRQGMGAVRRWWGVIATVDSASRYPG
jgi:hypothetical protein